MRGWRQLCPVGGSVGKDEGVGGPVVCGAHVQSVGGSGAELPCRVQRVQLVALVDGCLRVGVVAREALVGVAVVDDGLWEGSAT